MTPSIYRSIEGTGRSRSHIQYEGDNIVMRRRGDGDDCHAYKPFCAVLSWFFGKGKGHRHPKPSDKPTPGGPNQPTQFSKSIPRSSISPTRIPDPITSSSHPTTPATTGRISIQNPSLANPPTSTYSSNQSNAIETSTLTAGSSSSSASTSPTSASDKPLSISTVIFTSTVISHAKAYPQTPPSTAMPPPGFPSPIPGSQLQSPSDPHRRLSTGAIVGIALGAFAAVLCAACALFLLLRRRRARTPRAGKRTSVGSSLRHLEPYPHNDGSSRPVSSVWTWFGSVSADPDFEPQPEPSPHSLDFRFSEKDAGTGGMPVGAYSAGPSPCPSPALAETRPLAQDVPSVHSPLDGLPRLDVPLSSPEASSSSDLVALARTDYLGAHASNRTGSGLERSVSGVSRTTATSGDVQSVEAL